MLSLVAPFGLAGVIREVLNVFPGLTQHFVFSVFLAIYLYALFRLATWVFCWLDYLVATTLRRFGFSPPGFQHWLGEVLSLVPKYVSVAVSLFVLGTIAYSIIVYSNESIEGILLDFKVVWGRLIRWASS